MAASVKDKRASSSIENEKVDVVVPPSQQQQLQPEVEEEDNSMQPGVKKIELLKQVWTKSDIYIICIGVLFVSWSSHWEGFILQTINPNVTSSFGANAIMSILSTVTNILQSVLFPTYSKLSDMIGRAEMFTVSTILYAVSYIIMATSQNYATLVGGKVINTLGDTGIMILCPILIGDLTSVKKRGFYHGLFNIPRIINLYATSYAGNAFWYSGNWRWGYGHIPFLLCGSAVPLLFGLFRTQKVFKERGLYDNYKKAYRERHGHRSRWHSFIWYLVQIDIVGAILLVGGLAMILLPLVLARKQFGGWATANTLGTLCGGVVTWALLVIWEWKYAEKPLVPLTKWPNNTAILGVCAVSTVTIISSTNWLYFNTYLQVSRKISPGHASMLGRGYNTGYMVVQFIVGYLMMKTRVWRPYVWGGVTLMILGVGLMIPARKPSSSEAFVVISQTIAGIGSGMMDIPLTVAVQSCVPHDDMAMVTALFQVGGSIAAAIGSTMAGSIWNNLLPQKLEQYVPGDFDAAQIMGSISVAQGLPEEQYQGVVQAYSEVIKTLSTIAVCVAVLTFSFTIRMRSFGLSDSPKNREEMEKQKDASDTTTATIDEKARQRGKKCSSRKWSDPQHFFGSVQKDPPVRSTRIVYDGIFVNALHT
ncbi:major facilitator superfamily domain-containing protein [Zychaea mexicana]|uniref:major facilitator superfamily domain-containing protein n=1 Tax=Zychaea mexicana TaxID=64656 RepID=UPI0022FDC25B|nr:major facilitator superfamily domain-containing protein [Zychaea mexicana]KAI9497037.1 major facilitator superfamily domain-containing protein [Zychaea mexicana]